MEHPVFRRRRFFKGDASHGGESELGDIAWFTPTGQHMGDEHWTNGYARSVMVFLNGDAIPEPGPRGQRVVDDSFLVLFNAHHEVMEFTLPEAEYGASWEVVIDTGRRTEEGTKVAAMESLRAVSRSTIVLRRA